MPPLFVGWGMVWGKCIQVVAPPVARIVRMVLLAVVLLRVVQVTCWVLALVMPLVLSAMPWLLPAYNTLTIRITSDTVNRSNTCHTRSIGIPRGITSDHPRRHHPRQQHDHIHHPHQQQHQQHPLPG